jgi:selenocysteine lyase/cysteine desulfurase
MMKRIGMEAVADHERKLLEYTLSRMKEIPGVHFYGPTEKLEDKVGVIAFNLDGMHPGLVGAILGTEGGIGVRTGYFCAQPYVKRLLNVDAEHARDSGCGVVSTDAATFPGMVRASFGCYTNESDINAFLETVRMIAQREFRGEYVQDPETGAFRARGFEISHERYFKPFEWSALTMQHSYSETAWG